VRRSRDCHLPYAVGGNDTALRDQLGIDPVCRDIRALLRSLRHLRTDIAKGNFYIDRHVLTVNGQLAWQVAEGYTLTSVTGYMDGAARQTRTSQHAGECLPSSDQPKAKSFPGSAVRQSCSGSSLRWLVGSLFVHDKHHMFTNNEFFQPNSDGTPGVSLPRIPTFIRSRPATPPIASGFSAKSIYSMTEALTATLGTRWSRDKKSYEVRDWGWGYGGPISDLTGAPSIRRSVLLRHREQSGRTRRSRR